MSDYRLEGRVSVLGKTSNSTVFGRAMLYPALDTVDIDGYFPTDEAAGTIKPLTPSRTETKNMWRLIQLLHPSL